MNRSQPGIIPITIDHIRIIEGCLRRPFIIKELEIFIGTIIGNAHKKAELSAGTPTPGLSVSGIVLLQDSSFLQNTGRKEVVVDKATPNRDKA